MSDAPSQKLDQYIVRFPDGMRDDLKALATARGRSMNAEIVVALRGHLAAAKPATDAPIQPVEVLPQPERTSDLVELFRRLEAKLDRIENALKE